MPRRPLAVLFFIVFTNLVGFGLVIPLLPLFAREHRAGGMAIGALVAVYALMQFIFSPIWGRVSDRIGRRPVLLLCLCGAAVGHLLFAAADSLAMLFVARIAAGLFAATVGTAQAAVADVTSLERRARGMGIVGAAFGLGFVFGPPLGGLLASTSTSQGLDANVYPGLGAAAFALLALLVTFLFLRETNRERSPRARRALPPQFDSTFWRVIAGSGTLRSYFLACAALVLALTGLETIVPIYARDRLAMMTSEIGMLFGFLGAVMALVQATLVAPLARAMGERRLLLFSGAGLAISLASIPMAKDRVWIYAIAAAVAATEGLAIASVQSLVSSASPVAQSGVFLGMLAATSSLAQILGSMTAGVAYAWGGAAAPFAVAAVIVALAVGSILRTPGVTSACHS